MKALTAEQRIALRWIPKGAAKAQSKDGHAVVYYGKSPSGKLWAMGFSGTSQKNDFHHSFPNEESRAKFCAHYFSSIQSRQAAKAERQSAKKAWKHTLSVGDVLETSWGYDQTNVEYFEVTKLIGESMVEVREIAQESEETGFMSGKCIPVPGKYIGEPLRKRVLQNNRLDIHGGFGYAHPAKQINVAPGVKVFSSSYWSNYA